MALGRSFTGVVAVLLGLVLAPAASGDTFRVNSTKDANDANIGNGNCATAQGDCTLRAAVDEANFADNTDKVILEAKTYKTKGVREDANDSGDFDVALGTAVRIVGAGMNKTVIDGGKVDRLFQGFQGTSMIISNLKLTNGKAEFAGRRISNSGHLVLKRVAIVKNDGGDAGGGISSTGTMKIDKSLISRNKAGPTAGGISVASLSGAFPGNFTIKRSTISENDADGPGGGLFFSGGQLGTREIINSTFYENTASEGGAIFTEGTTEIDIVHSTFTQNSSDPVNDGAIRAEGPVFIANSLFGQSRGSGDDCGGDLGAISSSGFNLDEDGSCGSAPTDITVQNAKVGSLRRNGGPTPTVALRRRAKRATPSPRTETTARTSISAASGALRATAATSARSSSSSSAGYSPAASASSSSSWSDGGSPTVIAVDRRGRLHDEGDGRDAVVSPSCS